MRRVNTPEHSGAYYRYMYADLCVDLESVYMYSIIIMKERLAQRRPFLPFPFFLPAFLFISSL